MWVESPCFLWSISVSVLHRDIYQDNQSTLWGTLFQMLEEGSSTCTTPVLHLSFFALHWSSDTRSMPVTYLRRLGERKNCLEVTPSKRERQTNLPSATKGSPSLKGTAQVCFTAFLYKHSWTKVWDNSLSAPPTPWLPDSPSVEEIHSFLGWWCGIHVILEICCKRSSSAKMLGWTSPGKNGSLGEAGRESQKTNMFKQKAKFPMSHQALLSLPKLAARCQAMQVVMVLLFDEKRRCGSWKKGACSFSQNLLQDTTSGSQILVQWSPSLQVTSYHPLWLEPDWSLSSLSYCKTPQGHNFWQRGLDTSSRAYVSPKFLSRNTHVDAVFPKQEKGAGAFDCVNHKKMWKILREIGIPDHLTCLLRNLYAGQEATVRTGHGTEWFQIGKGVCQGCILSPCLLNLHAEYIMRNSGLDEAQVGIKIARRNINNLRYADDTTLRAESEEQLKSLLKVKEESEKVGLKLNIQKT